MLLTVHTAWLHVHACTHLRAHARLKAHRTGVMNLLRPACCGLLAWRVLHVTGSSNCKTHFPKRFRFRASATSKTSKRFAAQHILLSFIFSVCISKLLYSWCTCDLAMGCSTPKGYLASACLHGCSCWCGCGKRDNYTDVVCDARAVMRALQRTPVQTGGPRCHGVTGWNPLIAGRFWVARWLKVVVVIFLMGRALHPM